MTHMQWLALDIGGAYIKTADGCGYAASYPFALWKNADGLTHELRRVISEAPACDHLVATMTGELADCYQTKEQGVEAILEALQSAADGRHTRVYANDGSVVTPLVARRRHTDVAAANWHALARYCGRFMELDVALLIDVGSTTSDVIPFRDGLPVHTALTDTQRLISGELVYSGVQRSPLCAITRKVPYREHLCPLAHEVFATTLDVYLILGDLPEDKASYWTADGRPATKPFARARLARSICADSDEFNHRDAVAVALTVAERQAELLTTAMERVLQRVDRVPQSIVICGQGEFLARRAIEQFGLKASIVSLRQQLGPAISRCATAHALAVIAQESAGP
jgi:probable H4MPT-linked C1 transfer pathway protein